MKKILETVINHDPALTGFTPDDLPDAAKARIQNTLVWLERKLTSDELTELEQWTGGVEIFDKAEKQCWCGECCYYVYGDGSLYFRSSGDSEVWASAADFADVKIINGYDGPLDVMDTELLLHLGGRFEEEISKRGKER